MLSFSFIKELLEHLSELKAAGIIDLIVKLIQSIFWNTSL